MRHVVSRSLWDDTLPDDERFSGVTLPGDTDVDVAIVGGGLTGLWTAYHLVRADPSLRVVVLEAERVGFGASGRNGGWCSGFLPMSLPAMSKQHGRAAAIRLQRAMHDTVDEVRRSCDEEGIDAGYAKGGSIDLARTAPQEARLRAHLAEAAAYGFGDDDHRWLGADEARATCSVTDVRGGVYTPHCAAVHPARLVHGVAAAATRRGARIHEHTRAVELEPRLVRTEHGSVRAEVVVRATEAYTATLPGARRELVPIYSLMVATEPLSDEQWDSIGLRGRPTFTDARRLVIYGQRTADGRLAFGGRGAPYHFGSAISGAFDTDERVRAHLTATLRELFPVLADTAVTHHWGGPLGVPRDWHCSVRFDRRSGVATAGGYVGDGVATTNLAGRTLADLVTGRDSDLVRLPWVGHRSRRWEPEPFRWLGVNGVRLAATRADQAELRRGTSSRWWQFVMSTLLRR